MANLLHTAENLLKHGHRQGGGTAQPAQGEFDGSNTNNNDNNDHSNDSYGSNKEDDSYGSGQGTFGSSFIDSGIKVPANNPRAAGNVSYGSGGGGGTDDSYGARSRIENYASRDAQSNDNYGSREGSGTTGGGGDDSYGSSGNQDSYGSRNDNNKGTSTNTYGGTDDTYGSENQRGGNQSGGGTYDSGNY